MINGIKYLLPVRHFSLISTKIFGVLFNHHFVPKFRF